MTRTKLSIVFAVAAALALSGCTTAYGPKQTGGALIGGGLGALAGSQIGKGTGKLAAVGAGTLIGALIGSEVGVSLDRADLMYANQTAGYGLESVPSGSTVSWSNPDSGHHGTFTPQSTYQAHGGQYCREFQQSVVVGGRVQNSYGTACRRPDGSWEIVSQ